jgi:hypothetical protein
VTVRAGASLLMLMAAWVAPSAAGADDDFAFGRRLFLDKAECSFCHGWPGDGSGQPQSPGRAANLRKSQSGRDALITTILCGIPDTAMPHFDELAYTDKRCYGMTEAELAAARPHSRRARPCSGAKWRSLPITSWHGSSVAARSPARNVWKPSAPARHSATTTAPSREAIVCGQAQRSSLLQAPCPAAGLDLPARSTV